MDEAERRAKLDEQVQKAKNAASAQSSTKSRELAVAVIAVSWGSLIASEGPLHDLRAHSTVFVALALVLGVISVALDWCQYLVRYVQEYRAAERIREAQGERLQLLESRGVYPGGWWRKPANWVFVAKQVCACLAAASLIAASGSYYRTAEAVHASTQKEAGKPTPCRCVESPRPGPGQ